MSVSRRSLRLNAMTLTRTVSSIIRYAMAVDALLDIKVVDDCGEGVPATWQMTGAAKATVRVPATPRQAQTISITQELAHV